MTQELVIKRKVPLSFLGDEYAEAYILFRAMPATEYKTVIPQMEEVRGDKVKSTELLLSIVKGKFISGRFPNESGELVDIESAEALDGLDEFTLVECFEYLTGQKIDPKLPPQ